MVERILTFAVGLFGLFLALLPEAAWACPYCAQNDGGGFGRILTLGAMIVFPFVLVPGIIYMIRKSNNDDMPY